MSERLARVIIGDSRKMPELSDKRVDLVVTSPPYWHLKDYGIQSQVGYNQTLHEYLKDLYHVWKECYRVLKPGTRLCINIGDQFLRSVIYGRYRIAPLHAELIVQCERLGFDYMGAIIWQKRTTMNTTGGASVMGSFPYPGGGLIEIDYEFILVFKKPGKRLIPHGVKEASKLSVREWKEYFSGHWNFAGERQVLHEAMFPDELPRRLIRMYTYAGETVLDPFLGSGTTIKVALELGRKGVGYEVNEEFLKIIREKIGQEAYGEFEVVKRGESLGGLAEIDYTPSIQDAKPLRTPEAFESERDRLYRVSEVIDESTLKLDTGLKVGLLGVRILRRNQALEYLNEYVRGKQVSLKFDGEQPTEDGVTSAYVYLKNKIFVNKELVRRGIAAPADYEFKFKERFRELSQKAQSGLLNSS